MKPTVFSVLDPAAQELIESAEKAMHSAYAPYSKFAVGAAVRTSDGKIYDGANLENAVYGLGICAEVSAIAKANTAEGGPNVPVIETIAIVGGPLDDAGCNPVVVTPCGRCRQVIQEIAQAHHGSIRVLSCSGDLKKVIDAEISELLPCEFGAANLPEPTSP